MLTAKAAVDFARAIQRANPKFITDEVIEDFLERVGGAPRKKTRRKKKGDA